VGHIHTPVVALQVGPVVQDVMSDTYEVLLCAHLSVVGVGVLVGVDVGVLVGDREGVGE
jgi:hypothetical protein